MRLLKTTDLADTVVLVIPIGGATRMVPAINNIAPNEYMQQFYYNKKRNRKY